MTSFFFIYLNEHVEEEREGWVIEKVSGDEGRRG